MTQAEYDAYIARSKISHTECGQFPAPLATGGQGEAQGAGCPLVRFTLCRVRLLDVDAKYASVKHLLDGLQAAGLIHGDKEGEIHLEVNQIKVKTRAEERTEITIG